MPSGNLNTYGGKKNNFSFQQNLLLINSAISAATQSGAKEATLQMVLNELQIGREFEAKLVRDSDIPPVNWLEVRLMNQSTGVFDPPVYYLAGSNTVGSPVLPIVYIDPTTLLSTIASNTTGLATEVTLESVNGKLNSLGQKVSEGSVPVVLSTEQEAMIDGIETILTTIDADTSNLDVALSTRASEATLTGVATDLGLIYTNLQLNTILAAQTEANIDASTWDTTIGNTKVFSYYAGTEPGHPATSTTEVKTIEFRNAGGATLIFTQTFTYDAANNVLTIVVT